MLFIIGFLLSPFLFFAFGGVLPFLLVGFSALTPLLFLAAAAFEGFGSVGVGVVDVLLAGVALAGGFGVLVADVLGGCLVLVLVLLLLVLGLTLILVASVLGRVALVLLLLHVLLHILRILLLLIGPPQNRNRVIRIRSRNRLTTRRAAPRTRRLGRARLRTDIAVVVKLLQPSLSESSPETSQLGAADDVETAA